MLRSKIINRLVLFLVLVGALGFFSFRGNKYFGNSGEVSSRVCHEVEHFYYDDATFTNQVGYKWLRCNGTTSWGIVTQYDSIIDGECCSCCGYCPEFCDPWEK